MYKKGVNSISLLQQTSKLGDIIKFYIMVNQLKDLYRQGWIKLGGEEVIHKTESVAEHCFSMGLLGDGIIKKHNLALDADKCMKMALVHELGEIIIGDYTPDDYTERAEKIKSEEMAVREVLNHLDWAEEYYDLWLEFEAGETDEAIFMEQVDKFDFLMQGVCYGYDVDIFKYSMSKIKNPILLEILEELKEVSKNGNRKTRFGDDNENDVKE